MDALEKQKIREEFGKRLTEALESSRMAQGKHSVPNTVATEMIRRGHDLTPMAVRKWMAGEGIPTIEKLFDLAELSECSMEYLLQGRGPQKMTKVSWQLLDVLAELPVSYQELVLKVAESYLPLAKAEKQRL